MKRTFSFDGREYDVEELPEAARSLLELMTFSHMQLQSLFDRQATLTRARNAYVEDLKSMIIREKTGIDVGSLLSSD